MGSARAVAAEEKKLDLTGGAAVVSFQNVSIAFEGNRVLENISFQVEHGETRIILGPAGCGKSTLMKIANGLLEPDGGNVTVFGQNLAHLTEKEMFAMRAHVGMVFQESALFDSLNVEDNVAYRLREDHVAEAEAHERVVEALRFVELEKAI